MTTKRDEHPGEGQPALGRAVRQRTERAPATGGAMDGMRAPGRIPADWYWGSA